MPQTAIKGVYRDGQIIPLEEIPFHAPKNVIIVFVGEENDESRYYKPDWILAEQQASEDYRNGNVKSAESIKQMFHEIESNTDAD